MKILKLYLLTLALFAAASCSKGDNFKITPPAATEPPKTLGDCTINVPRDNLAAAAVAGLKIQRECNIGLDEAVSKFSN